MFIENTVFEVFMGRKHHVPNKVFSSTWCNDKLSLNVNVCFTVLFYIIQYRVYQQMHKFDLFDINWPTCFGLVWPSTGHYTIKIPRITVCQYK
jgi:hypothetical protein